ncbi:MAG: riboflavin synthase [Inconstantimicrobium porci]|uniref:riboflavin synthase n=1 Tax=Inconstantimicrobium porci TaxID=2652291 RepID=UPI0024099BDB|nr:riboflavin synthase [Inconstantimicrobium porci]MDD6771702.1 riboflavin synthase [Inconstantimicrobium porci]MDY5912188.1 riboflavin synthase [Inconstantimicrobium porci]
MFTGIIEEVGIVKRIENIKKSLEITIEAEKILEDVKIGDSIAVNGICLTVTRFNKHSFSVCAVYETLLKSSMSGLRLGQKVNVERAMSSNGRFGGHIIYGHVDGTGKVTEIREYGNEILMRISAECRLMRYIVEKGAVAIDGISLTIAEIYNDNFTVSVIPHTMENTILKYKSVNSVVNIENDYICKCIEKFLPGYNQGGCRITQEWLEKYGY